MSELLRISAGTLTLRDFVPDDAIDVLGIVGDDRVTRWLSFDSRNLDGAQRMIKAAISTAAAQPRSEYYLAAADPDTDRVIGFVRLAVGTSRAAKLGYAIHADHWRRGHATAAAAAIIRLGFHDLELHRITGAVGPDNYASQAVLMRLDFTLEGRLRDHVFTNGAWRDSLLFSLLADEWAEHL